MIENGVNVNIERNYALRCSSENGHLDIVKYLIEYGKHTSRIMRKILKTNIVHNHDVNAEVADLFTKLKMNTVHNHDVNAEIADLFTKLYMTRALQRTIERN